MHSKVEHKRQETTIATPTPEREAKLRILATSDLHMQITAFDYTKDCPNGGGSLARLATLVTQARAEAQAQGMACLLLDNGDTLQGTPLADFLATSTAPDPHPMIACMTHMGYHAGGLGNHDFDHGLETLCRALQQHRMAVVCSNMQSTCLPMVHPHVILDCKLPGTGDVLRVGILSSLPEKTSVWSRHHLRGLVDIRRPLPILRDKAAALRAQGADLVVVLAHMGLAVVDEGPDPQNRIADVAAFDDIDVIIGGHTHLRFPGPDHQGLPEVDCEAGLVRNKPMVQPGPSAADLGCIDLKLNQDSQSGRWRVAHSRITLMPATTQIAEDPDISEIASSFHQRTRNDLSKPVAQLSAPMNSFFALAQPGPLTALLATAKLRAIAQEIAGTPAARVPLLAAASAPATGGFDGPDNFLDLAKGPIRRHHVAGLNPYANHVWAVKTNGAQVRDWLERAAMIFNTLLEDAPGQMLINPQVPGFRFDTIYGLTYEIDPRVPPKYDAAGRVLNNRGRIRNLRWKGVDLDDDQAFIVATTDHRAGGGGLYKTFPDEDIATGGERPLQDAVLEVLRNPDGWETEASAPWSFVADCNRTAILLTAPKATQHLDEIVRFSPEVLGLCDSGFARIRLHL